MTTQRFFHHANGQPSSSKFWAVLCNLVVLVKFALGGMSIAGIVFPAFDAAAAAFIVGVFNAVYVVREGQLRNEEVT